MTVRFDIMSSKIAFLGFEKDESYKRERAELSSPAATASWNLSVSSVKTVQSG